MKKALTKALCAWYNRLVVKRRKHHQETRRSSIGGNINDNIFNEAQADLYQAAADNNIYNDDLAVGIRYDGFQQGIEQRQQDLQTRRSYSHVGRTAAVGNARGLRSFDQSAVCGAKAVHLVLLPRRHRRQGHCQRRSRHQVYSKRSQHALCQGRYFIRAGDIFVVAEKRRRTEILQRRYDPVPSVGEHQRRKRHVGGQRRQV